MLNWELIVENERKMGNVIINFFKKGIMLSSEKGGFQLTSKFEVISL